MIPLLVAMSLPMAAQPPIPLLPDPLPIPMPMPRQPLPLPVPQPLPPPGQPVQPIPVAITVAEFSRTFTPLPGKHEVWFVHPVSKQPVLVSFTLPEGRMRRFEVDDRWIDFRFDKRTVKIDFRRNGKVDVDD